VYETAYVRPDGASTAGRVARTAARYGYDGLVVRAVDAAPDYATAREVAGVDVVDAVEVVADAPASASGAVGNYRPKRTVVVVRGGTDALNRFAVEQDRVDVLAAPFDGDGDVNHVLANAAREHGVRIEFDLGPVLRDSGGGRVRAIAKLRKLAELVDDADAPFVASARATSHLELRAPRELAAAGEAIGLGADRVEAGLREWGRLAARNRDRLDPDSGFVAPGVRVVDDEGDGAGADDLGGDGDRPPGDDGSGDATDDPDADVG
jgi:ribonuclease P/MRP protein subunit RPP1